MKRLSLFIILIFGINIAFAQLQVKEGSFKKVDGFVNINIEKMYDDNDKPYAVLKIKTENINDKQRRELGFGGDAQTFFEVEYKDGEVWLYISYYATFLKISHPDLSSTEFWFPFDMEPKRGYELTLVNKPSIDEEIISRIEKLENSKAEVVGNPEDFGYIVVKTGSLEGATVYIDGMEMEMKTPFVSDPIKKGPHKIKVVKDGYEAYSDVVAVDGNGMKTVNVNLKKEKTTNLVRDKKFVLIPEMNLSSRTDVSRGFVLFSPQLSLEYMIHHNIGLGIGSGFLLADPGIGAIPVYGQISYYLNHRKVSPFLNIKIGYSIEQYNHSYYDLTEFYGFGTLGANINSSRIGVCFGICNYLFWGVSYSYLIPFGKKK